MNQIDSSMPIKNNLIYSALLTLSTYLVPLIVFPYISRVLGPSGVGAVDSADSIINYFIQFSMMGVATIGIREIARSNGQKSHSDSVFSSLFVLNMLMTIVAILILVSLMLFVTPFNGRKDFLCIGISKLVFNLFLVEWLFRGFEQFRYITIRSVFVKVFFVIAVFCFVKSASDVKLYYVLFVSMTVVNSILNWCFKKNFVSFSLSGILLKKYAMPFFLLGLYSICAAIYTELNVAYLGFAVDNEQVGYYTTSTRLYFVIMALFTSLTSVLLPRISSLVEEKKWGDVRKLVDKAFEILFLFTIPVIIFFFFFSPDVVRIFAGEEFMPAVLPMRIVMLQLLVIGVEQILILQLIIPNRLDWAPVTCSLFGVFVCILGNMILIPKFMAAGSAIVWLSAEMSSMIIALIIVKKKFNISFPIFVFYKYLKYSIPYLFISVALYLIFEQGIFRILIVGVTFLGYFILMEEKLLKMNILKQLIKTVSNKK